MKFKADEVVFDAPFVPAGIVPCVKGTVSKNILRLPYIVVEGDTSRRPFIYLPGSIYGTSGIFLEAASLRSSL
jgi:hypothetical protein